MVIIITRVLKLPLYENDQIHGIGVVLILTASEMRMRLLHGDGVNGIEIDCFFIWMALEVND